MTPTPQHETQALTPEAIQRTARAATLLVVSDFDGTLAGFSTKATDVPINQRAVAALHRLAELPRTFVAVLSGRHLEGLKAASKLQEGPLVLVGSHGAESTAQACTLSPEQAAQLDEIHARWSALIEQAGSPEGAFVEVKPFHRVLHVFAVADREVAEQLMRQALAVEVPGVSLMPGKNIAEAACLEVTKGTWIAGERERTNPDTVVFIGDDTTDERGFAVLEQDDLSVKVGPGATQARYRVEDIDAVADLLTELAAARAQATRGGDQASIDPKLRAAREHQALQG